MKKFAVLSICLAFWGCSHEVTVESTVSPVAYQLVDRKVGGNIAILVHPDLADLNLVVKPRGRSCSAVNHVDRGGLGLGLHERPIISRVNSLDHPMEIKEGMVFAVETWAPAGAVVAPPGTISPK